MFWSRPPIHTHEYQSAIAHRVRDILTGADHTNHHKHLAGKKNKMAIKALQKPEALAGVIDILRTMPEPTVEPMDDDDSGDEDQVHGTVDDVFSCEGASASAKSEMVSINSTPSKDADKGKEKAVTTSPTTAAVVTASAAAATAVAAAAAAAVSSPAVAAKAPASASTNALTINEVDTKADKDKSKIPDKTMVIAAAVTGTMVAATVVTTSVVKRPLFYPPMDIVSSQAFWWGYEVYIPEKALSRIAAAQDVSTAFLSFLSTVGLMVPAIVPFLGYIAAYVGLEFAVIKAQNEGKGVILASTWLLPVALVPRAWDIPDPEPETEKEKVE
ncbi:hypothetical protein BGZ73_004535 [Actinomortierella ambigua]|nr:hypothetical protein BGZ73_004535 [Actinomortierella ambigua]